MAGANVHRPVLTDKTRLATRRNVRNTGSYGQNLPSGNVNVRNTFDSWCLILYNKKSTIYQKLALINSRNFYFIIFVNIFRSGI